MARSQPPWTLSSNIGALQRSAAGPMTMAEYGCFGRPVHCVRNQTLVRSDEPPGDVYVVISGALRVCHLWPDGRRQILNFLTPGNYYGLIYPRMRRQYVEAVVDSNLQRYKRSTIEALLAAEPALSRTLFNIISDELSEVQEHLYCLGQMNAAERLADFLLHLASRQGTDQRPGNAYVQLPMNRKDIADHLGLRIETVSRALSQLALLGIIERPSVRTVVFLRSDVLEAIAVGSTRRIVTSDGARAKVSRSRSPQLARHAGNA